MAGLRLSLQNGRQIGLHATPQCNNIGDFASSLVFFLFFIVKKADSCLHALENDVLFFRLRYLRS